MNSDMEGSNVWGESPLSTEANSASVLYTAASGVGTAYPNPYNAFSADDTTESKATEDERDEKLSRGNNDESTEDGTTNDHPWGADTLSPQPYKTYSSIYDDNSNQLDEFRIQNELAQTMKSILLTEDKNAEDEGVSDDDEQSGNAHYDQTDHVHYVDNIHRKSDIGNPFLASSVKNEDRAVNRADINLLKEKKTNS